ncbi:MAG: cation diffusion facilitator family transporter [Pseudidiomarina maritima]|uniref:Cation-efflux pump FieF n=1 Tax=Pseudidiomarina sp. PP-1MA TaxID=3237706 RepID=A0AB39X5R3_9GAMM|nr:cation diffusion facilitator family transporter [Pseudidiomarina maritima]
MRDYGFWVKLATRASVSVALLLIVVKAGAWLMTDSSSMLASLTDSMLDSLASLFTFFAVRYAIQPADNEHRFGHGKAESLAALVQSALITGSALLLFVHSIQQWVQGSPVQQHQIGIYVSLFAIVATLALVILQRIVVAKTQSKAIAADSLHFTSDLALNTAVIVALLFNAYGMGWADSVFAIGIAIFLAYGAVRIGWDAFQSLMDRELPEAEKQQILATIKAVPGVLGVHDLRTRAAGQVRFVQCHVELDDHLSIRQAHHIADTVERQVAALFPPTDVIVHMDPQSVVPDNGDTPF